MGTPTSPLVDYKALFRSLTGPYIVFTADDPLFTIFEENDAHAKIAFSDPKKAIGRPLFDVFPDTSEKFKKTGVSDLIESLRKVIRTGKPDVMPTLKYDIPSPDGSFVERHWRLTHSPLFNTQGKVAAVIQNTEDITKEIAANKELGRIQRRLDDALAVGRISVWLWDITREVIKGDKNLALMLGIPEDEVAFGVPLSVFTESIFKEDRRRVIDEVKKTIAKGGLFEHEYRTISRDGTVRWVIARGRIEKDSQGKPLTFPGALVDITDRKIAEHKLQFLATAGEILTTSLDYKKTLQSIAALVVPDMADWCTVDILDPEKGLRQVALAHKDPKKVKWAKELRKHQPVDLNKPTGIPKVLRTGKPEFYPVITDELLVASAKSKEELALLRGLELHSVIIVPLAIDDKTTGAITLISAGNKRHYTTADLEMAEELASRASSAMTNAHLYELAGVELAKREALQEELRQANEQLETRVRERTAQLEAANLELERSNRELQDFAYVASHDLQEPLRKIRAFSNLLVSEYAERLGDGRDYLERMRSAAARMSGLIDDLLSFSRITTQARPFAPVDLSAVVREVVGDLEVRIEETEGAVRVGNLPTIEADPMQMRQLFQNLIANALKFHKPDVAPIVTVKARTSKATRKAPAYATLSIEDNGVGFDEKYLDRIFAVFQRLHEREAYEGTGIGLAVCRKIAERHGGTITASSKPGKGSIFTVRLPLKRADGDKND